MFTLEEVTHLGIAVAVRLLVQVEQALVDFLLQLQGVLDGLQSCLPLGLAGLFDILEFLTKYFSYSRSNIYLLCSR